MKAIVSLFALVLSAAALESRQSTTDIVVVSFANDLTGASVTFDVPADNKDHTIQSLNIVNGIMDTESGFMATSAQLVYFDQITNCMINNNWDNSLATLTAQATFSQLGNAAVDLTHVVINCYA